MSVLPMTSWSRRRLLRAGLAAPALLTACRMPAGIRAYPFTLGVASGEPWPESVVLWTRLAPEPLDGGGMPDRAVPVTWEVARDERMADVVRRGTALAEPGAAHSLHVEVGGLEPDRWYWYRFAAGNEASPIGRTRTAPAAGSPAARLRLAVASCQQYEHGFYAAYRHMAAEELDLVVHLGDYIYEATWGRNLVRHHGTPAAVTLADYRNRYALYKADADLQAAHAAFPWIVTWDDHEVANDYAGDRGERLEDPAAFRRRRAAAYQAWYEHLPLRRAQAPQGAAAQVFRRLAFGDLATVHVLDARQYRSPQACPKPGLGGGNYVTEQDCTDRLDPRLTMLGETQERWLADGLERSATGWNVIAQQTLTAQTRRRAPDRMLVWTDGWDGYPAARRRLLEGIAQRRPANPLVIGGDVHAFYVADLKPDFDDPRAPVVATEVCGTSITSQGPSRTSTDNHMRDNPHIRFADGTRRGYMRIELTRPSAQVALRALADPVDPKSAIADLRRYAVVSGRPGAEAV